MPGHSHRAESWLAHCLRVRAIENHCRGRHACEHGNESKSVLFYRQYCCRRNTPNKRRPRLIDTEGCGWCGGRRCRSCIISSGRLCLVEVVVVVLKVTAVVVVLAAAAAAAWGEDGEEEEEE